MTAAPRAARSGQAGFTLIEVAVALGILAIVLLAFLGTRTEALADASEARNWRLAKEFAEELLSELQAGAREMRPDVGRQSIENYDGFTYQIVIGETQISQFESYESDDWSITSSNSKRDSRLSWQNERDDLRAAQQKGMNLLDYREQQMRDEIEDESEDRAPSEDDLEEVLVVVYFPEVRMREEGDKDEASYKLKAKVSTLAIEGLTPDEASALSSALGLEQPETSAPAGTEGGSNQ